MALDGIIEYFFYGNKMKTSFSSLFMYAVKINQMNDFDFKFKISFEEDEIPFNRDRQSISGTKKKD